MSLATVATLSLAGAAIILSLISLSRPKLSTTTAAIILIGAFIVPTLIILSYALYLNN